MEDTIFILCRDAVLVDVVSNRERPLIAAVAALLAQEFIFLLIVLRLGMPFCADGENTILRLDFDVFLLEAREIGGHFIMVALIGDIGPEGTGEVVCKERICNSKPIT